MGARRVKHLASLEVHAVNECGALWNDCYGPLLACFLKQSVGLLPCEVRSADRRLLHKYAKDHG
jgi:hypothetical protein